MSRRNLLESSDGRGGPEVKPLEYGEYLYPGKRTLSAKKQYIPKIEEFPSILERDDHYISLEELAARFHTDVKQGLREEQVPLIRERYGDNVLSWSEEVGQSLPVYRPRGTYFFLCAGIIFCLVVVAMRYSSRPPTLLPQDNDFVCLMMVFTLIASVCVSIWQEKKADKIMKSFKDSYMTYASVFRDGKKVRIFKRDVVVGDLVLLKAGNLIPADIRITKAWNLKVDESPLTHIFETRGKSAKCTTRNPAFSENVVFAGSSCVDGYGQGIAFATGDETAFGRMMKETVILQKTDTSAHKEMRKVVLCLGALTLTVGIILFGMNFWTYYPWMTLVTVVLAQIIVSMPDILYIAITILLYKTAKKMVSKNCLPKHLEAVAKLSSVTVICVDKTGTITQNRMTVVHLWIDGKFVKKEYPLEEESAHFLQPPPNDETWFAFSRTAALCSTIGNKSRRNRCIIRKGCSCDQSEVAILEFVNCIATDGSDRVATFKEMYETVFDVPYNSYTKYHVTIHDTSKSPFNEESYYLLCMKGAVEVILKFCSTVLINGQNEPVTVLQSLEFEKRFERTMIDGQRIIGFCDYYMPKEKYAPGYEFQESDIPIRGMRFLGFVAMMDPPRASVPEAIKKCREMGIKVVLTSGDHPITAMAIAMKVGIVSAGMPPPEDLLQKKHTPSEEVIEVIPELAKAAVVTGSDMENVEAKDLLKLVKDYEEIVFARITPRQKIKILESLKSNGEIVALTGDSSEDAEAMHKADISIGMGLHGCDASRDAADVILTGDSFDSIVSAIEEGRTIYDNLQKAVVYVFSINVPNVLPFFLMELLQIPLPMGAGFLILINLIAEIFPVLMLTKDRPNKYIFSKRGTGHRNFFNGNVLEKAYFQVGIIGVASGMFVYFVILAENGFMPSDIIEIGSNQWNSPAINDLVDSFNQEWSYSARKYLEYTCQTGFFLSIIILQFFNLGILRTRVYRSCYCSWQFLASSFLNIACQVGIILILMYSFQGLHGYFHPHLYPLKYNYWLLTLPFPLLLLFFEELRRHLIRHSKKDSWLQREIF